MKRGIKLLLLLAIALSVLASVPVLANDVDTSKAYYIQSAMEYGRSSRGVWDVPGNPKRFKSGQNIKVWDLPSHDRRSPDRLFRFTKSRGGFYEISTNLSYKSRVDVAGGKRRNGTNIHLWERNNGPAQKFRMSYRGNGRWKIYPKLGGVICLKGKKSKNGTNVHIWNNHNGPWTEWVLIPYGTNRAFKPVKKRVVANQRMRAGLTLQKACQPKRDSITRQYFSKVDPRKFSMENKRQSLSRTLNRLNDTNRIILAKTIVHAIGMNPNSTTKMRVYYELSRSKIFKSSNFLVKMVIKQVEKEVQRNYRSERNNTVKNNLRIMLSKFK